MNKLVLASLLVVVSGFSTLAQHRLVTEVKKEISGMTLTVDNYKNSLKKIKKALENEETKDKAETWWIAGKIQYSIYDKMMANKAVGDKINSTDAGLALIDGYDKLQIALHKDTIIVLDKKGNTVIDKKTGKPKIRTKYSQEIMNKILSATFFCALRSPFSALIHSLLYFFLSSSPSSADM